jgi:acetyl-CoA carboxylase beta subunit
MLPLSGASGYHAACPYTPTHVEAVLKSHSSCSETFYKKEVELDIKSAPSKTSHERLKMMELLKKFEEENAGTGLEDDEQEDGDDLVRRFQGVDLGNSLSL